MRKVLLLSASFLLALGACKKDGELVPEFEENTTFSFFSDTTQIQTTVLKGQPVLADKIATGLVGEYRDSVFGYIKSNVYVQPQLPSNALIFKGVNETLTVDSVVLSLEYDSAYGNITIPQTFEVYRLDETLYLDTNYYSNATIQFQNTPLGSINFTPDLTTETVIIQPNNLGSTDTAELNPQLRIRLDNSLGEEIVSKQGGEELANDTNFVEYFKGLKITPAVSGALSDNEAAILYFRLTASNTKMTIYYNAINVNTNDTAYRAVDFPINTSSVRFNTFEHDYTMAAVDIALNNQNSEYIYTQAMASIETNISFPNLKENFAGKILINKAELILPTADGSYAEFGKSSKLILASRDDEGDLQFIPDALVNGEFFGGDLNVATEEYKFNITRYIQSYLNGAENENGLTLLVTGSAVKAERAVIFSENSLNSSDEKIRLNLYYTNTE